MKCIMLKQTHDANNNNYHCYYVMSYLTYPHVIRRYVVSFIYRLLLGCSVFWLPITLMATTSMALSHDEAQSLKQQITALYQQFAATSVELNTTTNTFCTAITATQLKQMRTAWRHSMNAWQRSASVRLVPSKQANRDLYIQFFPDKRGTIRRKLPVLLKNELVLTPAELEKHGVAATGLPALEWLLFSPDALAQLQQQPRRCAYLQAASQLLQQHAAAVVAEWQQVDATTLTLAALLQSSLEWLEMSQVVRLGAPMGYHKNGEKSRVKAHLAESWRSRHSIANLRAGVQGWQTIWLAKEAVLVSLIQKTDNDALIKQLHNSSDAVLSALNALPQPLFDALQSEDAETQRLLKVLYFEVGLFSNLIRGEVAEALGVSLGFNSLDGD